MIPAELLSAFALTSVLLAMAPGPDNIFVLTQSALFGARAGLAVTAGLLTGLLIHTTAVAFGVAAIFQASALAFSVLKALGAAYLLWLAWGAFHAEPTSLENGPAAAPTARDLYLRGIVMNVTNPKVAIFFLAFLPQFTSPARGALIPQILILGAAFVLCASVVFISVALSAGRLGRWLRRSERAQIILNRIAGAVYLLLACSLLLSHR